MAGITELNTVELNKDECFNLINKIEESKLLKYRKDTKDYLSVKRNKIPNLENYILDENDDISLEHTVENFDKRLFFEIACKFFELKNSSSSLSIRLEINESGKLFDIKEESDIVISFGCDQYGLFLDIDIGGVSKGSSDKNYRKDLFNRFLRVLNLEDDLIVEFINDEISLNIKNDQLLFPKELSFNPTMYNSNDKNLITINGGTFDRKDFSSISLYLFKEEEVFKNLAKLIDYYNAEKVLEWEMHSFVKPNKFEVVMNELNKLNLSEWKIGFWAKSKYKISELDKAIEENDSFLLHLFSIKIQKKKGDRR